MAAHAVSDRRPRLLLLFVVVPCLSLTTRARGEEPLFVPPDCGLNSLFTLLELSGNRIDLERLRRSLPPQTPDGYSMLDLKNAAESLGHHCRGIVVEKGEGPPNRPAIAFIGESSKGHFAVLRPVNGSESSRVQVFDSPYPPLLVDYAKLASDPHWTGKLLICQTTGEYLGPYLVWFSAGLLVLIAFSLRFVRARVFRLERRRC